VAQQLRLFLHEQGRFPTCCTWERHLADLPQPLSGLIGCCGWPLVAVLTPWGSYGRAAAVAKMPLPTSGGVWHKTHKEAGEIPHTSIETEVGWSQSGWHGWWYGWKLHLAVSVPYALLRYALSMTATP
jgi:hypothetical protein